MTITRAAAARTSLALPCLLVTCCVSAPPPAPEPVVVAAPAPAPPAPPPPTAVQPVYDDWMDAPRTPGDWSYRDGTGLSFATYGPRGGAAVFGLECAKSNGTVRLVRGGNATQASPMRIRTETGDRLLTATPSGDGRPMLRAELPGRDALLEQMAFSKGRFAVEVRGFETLYIPAWPEVTRVIEDCR